MKDQKDIKPHDLATHFIAKEREHVKGYAITLYRFNKPQFGEPRPQYLGPMGWQYHRATKDSDVLPKLKPISELESLTGDNIELRKWTEGNIYAG